MCAAGRAGSESGVEGVALIVIDGRVVGPKVAGRVAGIAAGESADDVCRAARQSGWNTPGEIGRSARNLRRADRHLPRAHQGPIDGDGKVDVRLADVGVIEEVVDAVLERCRRRGSSPARNLNAELMLLVAL